MPKRVLVAARGLTLRIPGGEVSAHDTKTLPAMGIRTPVFRLEI